MEPGTTNEPMRKRQADQRRRFHTVGFISIETEYQQKGDTRRRRALMGSGVDQFFPEQIKRA